MAANPHPGNDYYAQPSTGTIQRQDNPFAVAALKAVGFQGPFTWDQAQSAIGNYQQATAGTPAGNATQAAKNTYHAAQAAASANPLSGLAAIGDFFSRLSQANTWLRIGEGLLGIILIAVGLAKMTHAVPAATKIARAVT